MIVSTNKGGLSNRIKSIIHCVRYSKLNNVKYKVYWRILNKKSKDVHKLNCSFSKLFENNIEYKGSFPINKKYTIIHNPVLYIHRKDNIPKNFNTFKTKAKPLTYHYSDKRDLTFMYNKIPENLKKQYTEYFKVLIPKKELQDKINNFSKNFDKNTISLHIRSWNKKGEIQSRRKKIFKLSKFEKIMKKYDKNFNFFLSTDDSSVIKYFKRKYGKRILTYPRETSLNSSRNVEKGVQEDLIDLYLLSKNNIIIGSELSTFTEVAWWLGGCTKNIFIA